MTRAITAATLAALRQSARESGRTLTGEIIFRLQDSYVSGGGEFEPRRNARRARGRCIGLKVICNGAPKSGTHALTHAVQLLGFATKHRHGPHAVPAGRHIHIYRNPRNVMISWVRFIRAEYAQEHLMDAMRGRDGSRLAYWGNQLAYAHWLDDPNVLSVRFEDLITGDGLLRIADFLDCEIPDDAQRRLIAQTATASPGLKAGDTSALSDWRDVQKWHWNAQVEKVWAEVGGPAIERRFGYV